ncbi:MAG: hypothetical protein ACKPKO_25265 [Candidatus Fonsibacter sp.]
MKEGGQTFPCKRESSKSGSGCYLGPFVLVDGECVTHRRARATILYYAGINNDKYQLTKRCSN